MFSPKGHLTRRNLFLRLALYALRSARPRVINVDGHPAYASAITELKQSGELGRRCRRRTSLYMTTSSDRITKTAATMMPGLLCCRRFQLKRMLANSHH
jgi:transposase-like protein